MYKAFFSISRTKRYEPGLLPNDHITLVPPTNHIAHAIGHIDILIMSMVVAIEQNVLTPTIKSWFESKRSEYE
jgi:hypothetical protein